MKEKLHMPKKENSVLEDENIRGLLKKIGSLKVALILLLVLAFVSIIGTLVTQAQEDCFYIKSYGWYAGKIILFLGINDLYNSFFYHSLFFSLGLNLIVCTLNNFKPTIFKHRKKCALFLLHCSVLFIFAGGLISKFKRYSVDHRLLSGEKISLPGSNGEIVFEDFVIEFYPQTNKPKSYISKVASFEGGIFKHKHEIQVNRPLSFKGYKLYQSSFEVLVDLEIVITHANKIVWQGNWTQGECLFFPDRENIKLEIAHFFPDIYVDDYNQVYLNSYKLANTAVLINIYKGKELIQQRWIVKDKKLNKILNHDMSIFEFEVKRLTPFYATVLQVVKDPGIRFVWMGFGMLILGMTLFLSQKRF